jgi:hypothetical protein
VTITTERGKESEGGRVEARRASKTPLSSKFPLRASAESLTRENGTCKRCGAALSGRQRAWCSAKCRMASKRTATTLTRTPTQAALGSQEPTYRLTPENDGSRGQEAIDLALAAGLELDGFQQDWLRDGMATSGTRWASDEVVGLVARQNGKSVVLVIRSLWGPTLGGEGLVLFSSHQYKSAGECFLLAKQICETPAFARFEPKVRAAHGAEGIEFNTGGRLLFIARSRVSGRGFSPDVVIADEAFELNDLQLSALKPALAAAKQPQAWYASSVNRPGFIGGSVP